MPSCSPLRYAHSEGLTSLCYDDTGKYILTCGSDGDVRIWEGAEDDDAISHRTGDRAFCVTFKNSKFYVATDTNTVQAFTFPEGSTDGIVARFTAPVNHMCLNQAGTTLIAGSSDFTIKIVNIATGDTKKCVGHEAPVLSLALDPKEEYLASSSCDGCVNVWSVENQEKVKKLQILPKFSDVSLTKGLCRLCWQKDGKFLYVPMETEIQIYERASWTKCGSLEDSRFSGVYSVLDVSADGDYLAAGCYDGHILVYNLKTNACVDRFKHESGLSIVSLSWTPNNPTEIAFCDGEGQLGLLSEIELKGGNQPVGEMRVKETIGIFEDDDDADLVQATDDQGKAEDVNEDSNDLAPISALKPLEDDLESENGEVQPVLPAPTVIERPGFTPTRPQPAFQSGSTPVHLSSRFMMWNAVGIIKQFNTEEEESIDIEFHNSAVHHAMHLTNSAGYTMADISTEAVVLASPGDETGPSKLTCMHFGSWDNSKEWTIPMDDGEEIEAVTVGEDWIAVTTSDRVVRIFSLGGLQKDIFSIPGPIVCLSAHTNQLLIVYHRGMGLPGDQCLGVHLMTVEGATQINHQPLPLSSHSTLTWIGFSAEGTPFYMDSRGIVRMCNRKFGMSWVQVADTKSHTKGKSDNYWIVSIHENPQQLRCIPCKGSRFPPVLPRPAVAILPFQISICQSSTEKSQYEEIFHRTQLLSNHLQFWNSIGYEYDPAIVAELAKPSQEALMKLFALSARSDREFRALEVCEMMAEPHTLQLAIKYACRLKYMQLAERISEVVQRKSAEQEEEEQEEIQTSQRTLLNHQNHTQEDEEMEEDEVEVDQENTDTQSASGPLLNLKPKGRSEVLSQSYSSSGRSNPFKVLTPQKPEPTKGTQVFDSMSKKKQTSSGQVTLKNTKPVKAVKRTPQNQGKITAVKSSKEESINEESQKKSKSAFDLWFEETKSELMEEFPEVDDQSLVQTAAERFRKIPKEERQVWVQKSKEGDNKKRKREEDEGPTRKINPKLAAFAFSRD
ncbi:WD repeat and HMG-box DNA-binding protein 1-like [Ostrea edulis]|uniref:WD repeat and HMG-box DNA-binding protein 1-like n=1 Tax=Ostrea edulis TaxID=37623 RepID=UPI0024AFA200|nr:WD repeat and HMG-box DNA-binding protein 1-like [Ostrea edulis]